LFSVRPTYYLYTKLDEWEKDNLSVKYIVNFQKQQIETRPLAKPRIYLDYVHPDNMYDISKAPKWCKTVSFPASAQYTLNGFHETLNTKTIDVTNPSQCGLLIINDLYNSDWHAWDNGEPVNIQMTRFGMKSIYLPEGRHFVVLKFKPWWHPWIFIISWDYV